jgi:hypothetical protein
MLQFSSRLVPVHRNDTIRTTTVGEIIAKKTSRLQIRTHQYLCTAIAIIQNRISVNDLALTVIRALFNQ